MFADIKTVITNVYECDANLTLVTHLCGICIEKFTRISHSGETNTSTHVVHNSLGFMGIELIATRGGKVETLCNTSGSSMDACKAW